MADYLWLLVVALGPVLIGAVIAYAHLRRQRPTPTERVVGEAATRRLYSEDRTEGRDGSQPEH
jgi:hypothetical protein